MIGPSHIPPPIKDPLDRTRFPIDPWRLVETRFCADDLGVTESLFSVGNGYLGLRGNYPESRDAAIQGTYINGFHETWPIQHAEEAYGFAKIGQTIVNAPDAKIIRIYVDDEPLELSTADLLKYTRTLDFRTGIVTRDLLWRTPGGKRVRVVTRRMVSFTERHLTVNTMEVTLLDESAPIIISSQLLNRENGESEDRAPEQEVADKKDPRRAERVIKRVLMPEHDGADADSGRMYLAFRCAESHMTVGVVSDQVLTTENEFSVHAESIPDRAKMVYQVHAQAGQPIYLTKATSYHTARVVPTRELLDRCERTLNRVAEQGIDHQFSDQESWMAAFWQRCDVELPGHDAMQQAIRFNLFSVIQASGRAEGQGISAKGVSGSGYSGHYFWDTEVYVVPFLTYTSPQFARNALRFRYGLLDAARQRARELAQHGALFPWRTINGAEASAYYAAGTAQYHIDADISYALSQYVGATGDLDFLAREAIDILVETARLWVDLGFWRDEDGGTFHIHGVTGPDEYTTVVNDNLFTNVMARFNLRRACEAVVQLREEHPEHYAQMVQRTDLEPHEAERWGRAAESMFIPFDDHLGIHPQDSHFLEREMWDLANTPMESRPLLLHFHPLVIYRFQVLKQADVVLALFLQGEDFTPAEKRADFEYYDPITTGDSTLSAVVQSIIAAEVGYRELALRYFLAALFVDLADLHANTRDGVHIASAGGVWSALVAGFGGFRDHGRQQWHIEPRLPESWESLSYRLTLHGTRVKVTVRAHELELYVEDGEEPVRFIVGGEEIDVGPGPAVTVGLRDQGPALEGKPPHPAGTERGDGTVITATVPIGDLAVE